MRVGAIGNANSYYVRSIGETAAERGHDFYPLDFTRLQARVAKDASSVRTSEWDISNLDALIVRSMPIGSLEQVIFRMDALWTAAAAGVLVINSPKSLECAIDKYLSLARLRAANLPVPPTYVCESAEAACDAFTALGGDVIVKPLFGSEGRGMLRVEDPDLAERVFRTLERVQSVLYLQAYIDHGGQDVRLLVLDGRVIACMQRTAPTGFRTNVAQQGVAAPYTPTDECRDLAIAAAAATETVFAGVDLIIDSSGDAWVLEVNAVPGWKALQRVTGVDVATQLFTWIESLRCR